MTGTVAIVGAGISGLTLAHELHARDVEHVVLDASERAGGVIRSGRVDGHLLEWGPQRARLTQDLARLVEALGLHDRLVEAPADLPLFVYRRDRLRCVPFSAGAFLRSDLLPLSAKLRILAEPLTGGARPSESVGAYFRRKLGREAYESLAGPLYGGLYASDPDDMVVGLSLGHVLREFGVGRSLLLALLRRGGRIAAPTACSFREGLEELPRALLGRHRARVRLATPVRSIRADGTGWRVETASETIDAHTVAISVPARAASALLAQVAPDAAARIGRLVYNPLAVVHVHAHTGLRGLGYQVSLAESLVTRGVTFNDSLFARDGVYTIYLGGAKNRWVADAPEDELARIAVDEFRQVTGAESRVLSVAREWMPAWDRSWRAIQGMELPAGIHLHANWHARPGLPGRLGGSRRLAEQLAGSGSGR